MMPGRAVAEVRRETALLVLTALIGRNAAGQTLLGREIAVAQADARGRAAVGNRQASALRAHVAGIALLVAAAAVQRIFKGIDALRSAQRLSRRATRRARGPAAPGAASAEAPLATGCRAAAKSAV